MADTEGVALAWLTGAARGEVEVTDGRLAHLRLAAGSGRVDGARFELGEAGRLELAVDGARTAPGAGATRVLVQSTSGAFAFFLRDVAAGPLYVPEYGAVVTRASDGRTARQVVDALRARGLRSAAQQLAAEPEESFAAAAAATRHMTCETWLGLGRDMRLFALAWRGNGEDGACETWDRIQPRWHGTPVTLPEAGGQAVRYAFMVGRGFSCVHRLARRLEDGVLPILHATLDDGGIGYSVTAFCALETGRLDAATLRGTDYLVADGHGRGHMHTSAQQAEFDRRLEPERDRPEETVLYLRVEAVNAGAVARYAWLKAPFPEGLAHTWDGLAGCGRLTTGRVYCVARLDGAPLCQEEIAVLLAPGASATFTLALPHRPLADERAAALAGQDLRARHEECRAYWQGRLATAARVRLPEARIDEMVRAGLLHLDLVAYGRQPDGPVAPCIGVYCPIGSESAPILQFMDSMGWHDLARRGLDYFLAKQHDDGFMQNFGGYMLETGAALWTLGEHYRYTRDDAWAARVAPQVLRACDYLSAWRGRNQGEGLAGRGRGLLDGKVADPEDPYHTFMLNGYACLGLRRASELLAGCEPQRARDCAQQAAALRADIRAALEAVLARSPLVPLGDGTWCPSAAPWAEGQTGPCCLLAEGRNWFTHAAVTSRDSLVGPLYLVFQEVLEPDEPAAAWLLAVHAELMCERNAALTQPYYSRHGWVQLKRGEVAGFLKTYYNTMAALADRQTYTFWEHFHHASPHKTHEEAWFLMQTRWMLWLEDGPQALRLLPGIPRSWLQSGARIELSRVASYFGPLSLEVVSEVDAGRLRARVACPGPHRPETVRLRLPHPRGLRARRVHGGEYDAGAESATITPFGGEAEVVLEF